MTLRQCFAANLKKFRAAAKLSQMKLAETCDTATNYICEIEAGKKFPSVEMIEKIALALQVQPYLLFFDEQQLPGVPLIANKLKSDIAQQINISVQEILTRY